MHSWLNPWGDPNGASYQIVRSIHAMQSGGIVGDGIGHGAVQQIPLAHSDLIFPAIVNEWGKLGAAALLILILITVQRICKIALLQGYAPYLQFLGIGVAAFLAVQTIVNIGGVTGVLPLTGVPLPFLSYGGSAMLVWFAGLGMVFGGCREDFNEG